MGGGGGVDGVHFICVIYTFCICFFYSLLDWLSDRQKALDFELWKLSVLAECLSTFYAELMNQKGTIYSCSALLSIRAAIKKTHQGLDAKDQDHDQRLYQTDCKDEAYSTLV